jgi:hypothetical protein
VPARERLAEAVGASVRVAVQLGDPTLQRLSRPGERPELALVRGELHDTVEAELALHLLDGFSGLVRNEVCDRGAEELFGHAEELRGAGRQFRRD